MPAAHRLKYKVYMLTSPSGKKYVGYTSTSMESRLRAHVRDASEGQKRPICSALRKYGLESFKVRVLRKFATKPEALDYEILSIKRHKSNVKGYGYNATAGGECAHEGFGGAAWRKGKTQAEIDASNAKRGRLGELNGYFGRKHSRKVLRQMVATRRSRGSYAKASGSFTLSYKRKTYESKAKLREATGLTRTQVERLILDGRIAVKNSSVSADIIAEKRCKKIQYRGKTYSSMADLRDFLGYTSYKVIYKLLESGEARRV